MIKIQKNSKIEPALGFTEFDIFQKYRMSFECSELGHIHCVFPFLALAESMHFRDSHLGRSSYFSAKG